MNKENEYQIFDTTRKGFIADINGSFSILIWSKIENRPATSSEIDFLANGDDNNGQLFLAWNKVLINEKDKGVIHLHIDSEQEDNYEIRYLFNYF